jgi:hypothetical protein
MTRLSLTAYEDSTKASMIADWSSLAQDVVFETDEHGFANLSAFIPMSLDEAFRVYNGLQFAHVVLSDGAFTAFEGRLEDPAVIGDDRESGIKIAAFGYWTALRDVIYTALWSTQDYANWRSLTADDISGSTPAKFSIDSNDRLFIGLRKGETYATSGDNGRIGYQLPSRGLRDVVKVAFTYTLVGVNTSYKARLISTPNDDFSGGTTEEWSLTSSNGTQSSTHTETLTGTTPQALIFQLDADTEHENDQETGDLYLEITGLRVVTTSSAATINSDEPLKAIIALISGINSTQLSSSTALVADGDVDLKELIYEGAFCDRAVKDLAIVGDSSNNTYEVGVWEDQKLHYRIRGSEGQDWYTDAASIRVDSTTDTLWNSVAVEYRNTNGRTVRTPRSTDTASVSRYGVTRTKYVKWDTTDSTEAQNVRDVAIEDGKDITPRASITMPFVATSSGAIANNWQVRAGDTMTIRNLPVGSGDLVNKISKFRISRTRYDVDRDELTITPGEETPSLEFMVGAMAAEGR